MPVVSTESIAHLGLSGQEALQTVRFFLAEALRAAPCLAADDLAVDKRDYAEGVIVAAIERRHDMRTQLVESQNAGRQGVTTRPAASPRYDSERFTQAEKDKLASICTEVTTGGSTVPLGCFPEPREYRHLFDRPRQ